MIIGLDDIIAEAYAEGRPVNHATAKAILKKVAKRNHVGRSKREWYQDLILEEYRKYCETEPIAERGVNSIHDIRIHRHFDIGVLGKRLLKILPPSHPWF